MKRILTILITYCWCNTGIAQEYFNRTYDNNSKADAGGKLIILKDSNYLIAGESISTNYRQLNLLKLNQQGDTLWTKLIGTSDEVYYTGRSGSLHELTEGNIVLTGSKDSAPSDGLLVKFDANGDTLWTKRYGGQYHDYFNAMVVDDNGDMVLAGSSRSFNGDTDSDVYVVKVDSLGNIIWEKSYGGGGYDYATSITKQSDKGYFIGGKSDSFTSGNGGDFYLLKIDSIGKLEWDTVFGTQEDDGGYVTTLSDGNYIISGGADTFDKDKQGYISKISTDKSVVWEKFYGYKYYDSFQAPPVETNDGSLVFIGFTKGSNNGEPMGWLFKTNANGDSLWSRTFKIRDNDHYFRDIKQTDDGGFIIGGFVFPDGALTQDMWLVKVDSMGCDSAGCHLVGMDELPFGSAQGTMQIYPNPNNGSFVVSLSKERWLSGAEAPNVKASGQLNIYSITGRLLHQENIVMAERQVRVEAPVGVYFVEYVNADGAILREKVIIEY